MPPQIKPAFSSASIANNPNDNAHLSIRGMVETVIINFVMFVILMLVFESNRFYKQIYLKRLQNRFRVADRVPPYPSESTFGWFFEISKVSEAEVLRMVGLDAYMCLRYISICWKLCLFLSFWGILVLLPIYATAADYVSGNPWDQYSIVNLSKGDYEMKDRLWITAIFGYIFAAYFCQLLFYEYKNFSIRRLQFLLQADPDGPDLDPDTPPQKYYTVMIEHIPGKMRSAAALREFFERIFPNDAYTVEIALDIKELDALNAKRKRLRNKLEKAIAHYEASNERPQVYARTGIYDYDDLTDGIFGDDDIITFIQKSLQPEKFGYSKVDALQYYTEKLQLFNDEFIQLQRKYNELANKTDKQMMKLFEEKFDTRAAALIENITVQGAKALKNIAGGQPPTGAVAGTPQRPPAGSHSPASPHVGLQAKKILQGFKIENLVFGNTEEGAPGMRKVKSFHTAINEELRHLEAITDEERREIENLRRRHASSYVVGMNDDHAPIYRHPHHHIVEEDEGMIPSNVRRHRSSLGSDSHVPPQNTSSVQVGKAYSDRVKSHHPFEAIPKQVNNSTEVAESDRHTQTIVRVPSLIPPHLTPRKANESDSRDGIAVTLIPGIALQQGSNNGDPDSSSSSARPSLTSSTSIKPAGFDLLTQDQTISEWIRKSGVDFEKEEMEVNRKRSESLAQAHDIYRRDAQAELRAYMDQAALFPALSSHGTADQLSGLSSHSVRRGSMLGGAPLSGNSASFLSSASFAQMGSSNHGAAMQANHEDAIPPEVDRAAQLSSMTRNLLAQSSGQSASGNAPSTSHSSSHTPTSQLFGTVSSRAGSVLHDTVEEEEEDEYKHDEVPNHQLARGYSRQMSFNSQNASQCPPSTVDDFDQYEDLEDRNGQPIESQSVKDFNEPEQQDAPSGNSIKQRMSATAHSIQQMMHQRTQTGGVSSVLPVNMLTSDQLNELAKLSAQQARTVTKHGWLQTTLAGRGAWHGLIEVERMIEMIMLGALHKYSSTAFVTFNSRITESIAQQMLLSHDQMEINHAPNPHDIIWENIAIPKSQVVMRTYITNIGVIVGSIFWSSLVNSVNVFASLVPLPPAQQQIASAGIMLIFLIILPYIFDYVARFYEGLKLESEIQNSIMTRYFFYQLINVYVTVGFSGSNLWRQLMQILTKPQTLVDVIGGRMPNISLFFTNLMIVKILTAIPLEMIRPWQLSTIHLMGHCMDKRRTTRRDLRTGLFYSWPMLYGWIYPQLMMVLMIMVTYSTITPLLSPLGVIFFAVAYWMYKYQLLYVYINDYQSGGYMWYAVFHYTMIAMEFAACTLVGYLSLQLSDPRMAGPFFFCLPLPFCLIYFGSYCEKMFLRASMSLSYGFAKELDLRDQERRRLGKSTPHDTFSKTCYRQSSLTEGSVFPEPFRDDGSYIALRDLDTQEMTVSRDWRNNRRGSLSINVHELTDEGEENGLILETYFKEVVVPLSKPPKVKRRRSSLGDQQQLLSHQHHRRGVDGGESDDSDGSDSEDEYETDEEYDASAAKTHRIMLNSSNIVKMARESYAKAEAATAMLSQIPFASQQQQRSNKNATKKPLRSDPPAPSPTVPPLPISQYGRDDVKVEDVNDEEGQCADIEAGNTSDKRKKSKKPKEIVTRQRR
jgi:hypothetical protein